MNSLEWQPVWGVELNNRNHAWFHYVSHGLPSTLGCAVCWYYAGSCSAIYFCNSCMLDEESCNLFITAGWWGQPAFCFSAALNYIVKLFFNTVKAVVTCRIKHIGKCFILRVITALRYVRQWRPLSLDHRVFAINIMPWSRQCANLCTRTIKAGVCIIDESYRWHAPLRRCLHVR